MTLGLQQKPKSQKIKKKSHYLAKTFFGAEDRHLGVIPTDQLLVQSVKESYKTDQVFRVHANKILKSMAMTAFNIVAAIGGVVTAIALNPIVGLGIIGVGSVLGGFAYKKMRNALKTFKQKVLPSFKKKLTLDFKQNAKSDLKLEWQRRFDENLKRRKKEQAKIEKQQKKAEKKKSATVNTADNTANDNAQDNTSSELGTPAKEKGQGRFAKAFGNFAKKAKTLVEEVHRESTERSRQKKAPPPPKP